MNNTMVKTNFTIPNLISVCRILIIPIFVYYYIKDQLFVSVLLLISSGLSDLVDGFIARKLNQITDLGKILDPFADKLTQVAVAGCLAYKFPALIPFFILFLFKEFSMMVMAASLLKDRKRPCAARWYGKITTAFFYMSVGVTVLLDINNVGHDLFLTVSITLLSVTSILMIYSAIRYYLVYKEIVAGDYQEKTERISKINSKN